MGTTRYRPFISPGRAIIRTLGIVASVLGMGCAVRIPPAPTPPPNPPVAELVVDAERGWTDSGVVVRRGDRLVFWATGEVVVSSKRNHRVGPDGHNAYGQSVGRGGLVGRVGDGKPFDIGARTHLIWQGVSRAQRLVTPPPIEMKGDGALFLGVRDWTAGGYAGTFVVSIWRVPAPAPPSQGLLAWAARGTP